jgi:hypothetical protein
MFREEIGNGIVAGNAIRIFEDIMSFIFEDEQFQILALEV